MWNYQIEENILYEDKEILVCRKTAGMPVQAAKIGTMDMESALKNYLAQKTPGKIPYLGVTEGKAKSSEGTLTDYLKKNGKANMSQVVSANTPGAKKAILHYKVLDQQEINGKSRTLLKIRLETGRHHQIRVQLSHEGLPLLGDRKYNPSGEKGTSLGLCSNCLEFKHPRTGKMMKFETEPQGSAFLDFVKKV